MRIRSIKPEFWTSQDIANLSWDDRLLFIGLWSYVDDNGVGRDVPKLIGADLFPLDEDPRDVLARVSRGLDALSGAGLISRYTVEGRPYLSIPTWGRHQKIDRPSKARYPLPTCENAKFDEGSSSTRDSLDAGAVDLGAGDLGAGDLPRDSTADAADPESADSLDLGLPAPLREAVHIQALVGAYVETMEANGGIATTSQRNAIGANAKRLIRQDNHIPLPVILRAVQRAAERKSRSIDPFLGEEQSRFENSTSHRRAMFARWEEIAATFNAPKEAS